MNEHGADSELVNMASVETEDPGQILKSVGTNSQVLAKIENMIKIIDSSVKLALIRTKPQDWVKQGNKYYLQASGCQKVRPVFGVYYKEPTMSKEIFEDGTYAYICSGYAGSKLLNQLYGETEIWVEGIRNSKDPFFRGKDGKKEFDPMDVRKAAHANFQSRGMTVLLGLSNLTAADLKMIGVDVGSIPTVEYEKGSQGGGQIQNISQAQIGRLLAIASERSITDTQVKAYILMKYKFSSKAQIPRGKVYDEIVNAAQTGAILDYLIENEDQSEGGKK